MTPSLSVFERALARWVPVRAGEGFVAALLFIQAFVLLFAYYLVKPVREALILTEGSAEIRSYAVAAQAGLLMIVIPVYTSVLRRVVPHYHLVPWITAFLAANLLVFVACGYAGMRIGVPFFVWLGIFNVLIVAQFWAFAVDLFNVEAGERLFVPIAAGASIGAWVGAVASKALFPQLGPYGLMLATVAMLFVTIPFVDRARRAVPEASRSPPGVRTAAGPRVDLHGLAAGFRIVLRDRYLVCLALFVVLVNCTNSTGEYVLARIVREHAAALVASGAAASGGEWIGVFYGDYFTWVNGIGLLLQLLVVARIFRLMGVGRATLILPAFSLVGYALLAFVPVFAIVRAVKIAENAMNYSLQNTARHALFLPLDEDAKYASKTVIDTFCWRLGDLAQAGVVLVGSILGASLVQFALINAVLCLVWFAIAMQVAGLHRQRTAATA